MFATVVFALSVVLLMVSAVSLNALNLLLRTDTGRARLRFED